MRVKGKLRAAIETVVGYNWSDEIEDYVENCRDNNSGDTNQRKGHIFESLVLIANALDGTKFTPEYWGREYCKGADVDPAKYGFAEENSHA